MLAMICVDENGLVAAARQVPSPNRDARPPDCQPELIVLHGISLPPGEFGGRWIDDFFTNCLDRSAHPYFDEICRLQVSSHLLIRRDGTLVQYVPLSMRAWHAGDSHWRGRDQCNDFSIGIELEGTDDLPYSDAQYHALEELLPGLYEAVPSLAKGEVVGHCHISPGRKSDPGPSFDWNRLQQLVPSIRCADAGPLEAI